MTLKGRRKGFPDKQPKVDLRRIDQGRVAAPSWGAAAPVTGTSRT
ncbi:hypothetical protein V2I01_04815 [Micromonospora sp. BRA006-A]|nr:hypothetical protein [Micromonospora sp. BRA006-A]